jgi:hypothetical protein
VGEGGIVGIMMKTKTPYLLQFVAALALGACSAGAGLLDPKSSVPQASGVPVGNALALPPDLQLAAPTATSDAYQANGAVAPATPVAAKSLKQTAAASAPAKGDLYGNVAATAPAASKGDIFAQYGISKIGPDGKPKPPHVLADELNAAIIKKRREKNPNYGTIANIGAIFQDQ